MVTVNYRDNAYNETKVFIIIILSSSSKQETTNILKNKAVTKTRLSLMSQIHLMGLYGSPPSSTLRLSYGYTLGVCNNTVRDDHKIEKTQKQKDEMSQKNL